MSIDHLACGESFLSTETEHFLRTSRKQQHDTLLKQNLSTHLTTTELKTMYQISVGKATQKIADEWNRSHHTINKHRKNIINKLSLSNTEKLSNFCVKNKYALKTLLSIDQNKSFLEEFGHNPK